MPATDLAWGDNIQVLVEQGQKSAEKSTLQESTFGAIRCSVYDGAIVPFTTKWFLEVLADLPDGARFLDVSIGTGTALIADSHALEMHSSCWCGF